jgi:hypothetical protein
MIDYTFTPEELELVTEALLKSAKRHESESRFNPRNAAPHDKKASGMLRLRLKLLKYAAAAAALLALAVVAPAFAVPIAPYAIAKQLGNANYGKADDYGSERWRMAASCLSHMVTAKAEGRQPESFEACMNENGFAFCPDCKIFGNRGPKCLDEDHLHSWCWVKDEDEERD